MDIKIEDYLDEQEIKEICKVALYQKIREDMCELNVNDIIANMVRRNQKLAPNEVVVRRHSKVMGNQAPISLTFDISTVYPMRYQVTARQYEPSTNTLNSAPAQAYILEAFDGQEFTQKDVINATGKSPSTVSRQIKQLEATGAIEKMPNGKWRRKEME